mmetsp:Transcript_7342/g.18318  ORF Transcript_7342/g.18318 Transcript_7342/m.18318 type:complete len:222 (-) Transcript_7342:256-921(-)
MPHPLQELGPVALHLGRVLGVIGGVGEGGVGLGEEESVLRVVVRVCVDVPRVEVVHASLVELHDDVEELRAVRHRVDELEPRLERLRPDLLDARHVRARSIIAPCGPLVLAQNGDHVVYDVLLRAVPGERPRGGESGDAVVVVGVPLAARELVEVLARVHLRVDAALQRIGERRDLHLDGQLARLLGKLVVPLVVHHKPHTLKLLEKLLPPRPAGLRVKIL